LQPDSWGGDVRIGLILRALVMVAEVMVHGAFVLGSIGSDIGWGKILLDSLNKKRLDFSYRDKMSLFIMNC
jgi:hypothetical protein